MVLEYHLTVPKADSFLSFPAVRRRHSSSVPKNLREYGKRTLDPRVFGLSISSDIRMSGSMSKEKTQKGRMSTYFSLGTPTTALCFFSPIFYAN
jgi:hypothetical protein